MGRRLGVLVLAALTSFSCAPPDTDSPARGGITQGPGQHVPDALSDGAAPGGRDPARPFDYDAAATRFADTVLSQPVARNFKRRELEEKFKTLLEDEMPIGAKNMEEVLEERPLLRDELERLEKDGFKVEGLNISKPGKPFRQHFDEYQRNPEQNTAHLVHLLEEEHPEFIKSLYGAEEMENVLREAVSQTLAEAPDKISISQEIIDEQIAHDVDFFGGRIAESFLEEALSAAADDGAPGAGRRADSEAREAYEVLNQRLYSVMIMITPPPSREPERAPGAIFA